MASISFSPLPLLLLSFTLFLKMICWMSQDMDGNDVNLGSYSGKVLLIVNVASKWYLPMPSFSNAYYITTGVFGQHRMHAWQKNVDGCVLPSLGIELGFTFLISCAAFRTEGSILCRKKGNLRLCSTMIYYEILQSGSIVSSQSMDGSEIV